MENSSVRRRKEGLVPPPDVLHLPGTIERLPGIKDHATAGNVRSVEPKGERLAGLLDTPTEHRPGTAEEPLPGEHRPGIAAEDLPGGEPRLGTPRHRPPGGTPMKHHRWTTGMRRKPVHSMAGISSEEEEVRKRAGESLRQ